MQPFDLEVTNATNERTKKRNRNKIEDNARKWGKREHYCRKHGLDHVGGYYAILRRGGVPHQEGDLKYRMSNGLNMDEHED